MVIYRVASSIYSNRFTFLFFLRRTVEQRRIVLCFGGHSRLLSRQWPELTGVPGESLETSVKTVNQTPSSGPFDPCREPDRLVGHVERVLTDPWYDLA